MGAAPASSRLVGGVVELGHGGGGGGGGGACEAARLGGQCQLSQHVQSVHLGPSQEVTVTL